MDENSYECISVDIEEATTSTSLNLLPEISRKKYEIMYKRFMDWRDENKIDSFSENDMVAYFTEFSKKFKSSTLWSMYSMLRSTLSVNHSIDIAQYTKLRSFLKNQSHGYIAKQSKTFTSKEIRTFINEAPDMKYLLVKVALVIGITGACRREELCKLRINDMQDLGSAVIIKIPDVKKKYPRTFTITGHFYDIYKKYACLRPTNTAERRFFLNYQNGRCTRQVVGINKFGSMAKQIATFLKLPNPELYTGHCFRRSSATVLVDEEDDLETSKRISTAIVNKILCTTSAQQQTQATVNHNETNNDSNRNFPVLLLTPGLEDPLKVEQPEIDGNHNDEQLLDKIKSEVEDVDQDHMVLEDEEIEEQQPVFIGQDVTSLVAEVAKLKTSVNKLNNENRKLSLENQNLNVTVEQLRRELLQSKQNEIKLEQMVKAIREIVNNGIPTMFVNIKQEKD